MNSCHFTQSPLLFRCVRLAYTRWVKVRRSWVRCCRSRSIHRNVEQRGPRLMGISSGRRHINGQLSRKRHRCDDQVFHVERQCRRVCAFVLHERGKCGTTGTFVTCGVSGLGDKFSQARRSSGQR